MVPKSVWLQGHVLDLLHYSDCMGVGNLVERESIDGKRGLRSQEAEMYIQGLGEQRGTSEGERPR